MSNTDNIKQLIIDSESNLEKIDTILEDKEIPQLDNSEKELFETLLKDLKELGKNRMKNNQYYKKFCLLSSEELYLINIKPIIDNGLEILKEMKNYYKDLFLKNPPKFILGKSGRAFKTKR